MTRVFCCWLYCCDGTYCPTMRLILERTDAGWVSRLADGEVDPDVDPSPSWQAALARVQREWLDTGFTLVCLVQRSQPSEDG